MCPGGSSWSREGEGLSLPSTLLVPGQGGHFLCTLLQTARPPGRPALLCLSCTEAQHGRAPPPPPQAPGARSACLSPSGSPQPVPNHNPWMLLYFISFLLIVSFFVLNMFVGVVVENFHKCRQHQEAEEARRREEKRLRRLERKRRSKARPEAAVGRRLCACWRAAARRGSGGSGKNRGTGCEAGGLGRPARPCSPRPPSPRLARWLCTLAGLCLGLCMVAGPSGGARRRRAAAAGGRGPRPSGTGGQGDPDSRPPSLLKRVHAHALGHGGGET